MTAGRLGHLVKGGAYVRQHEVFFQCPKEHGNSQNNDLALAIHNGVACHQLLRVVRADLMRN